MGAAGVARRHPGPGRLRKQRRGGPTRPFARLPAPSPAHGHRTRSSLHYSRPSTNLLWPPATHSGVRILAPPLITCAILNMSARPPSLSRLICETGWVQSLPARGFGGRTQRKAHSSQHFWLQSERKIQFFCFDVKKKFFFSFYTTNH